MEGDFCSFCGALKVTATRLVCVGKTKKGPGRRNGIRRKRRREIPRATIDVVVCPACKKRDLAERRDRNTPAKWLAYVEENPLYFESIFGARDPRQAARFLFEGRGISEVKGRAYKKPRRIYVQVAAL